MAKSFNLRGIQLQYKDSENDSMQILAKIRSRNSSRLKCI